MLWVLEVVEGIWGLAVELQAVAKLLFQSRALGWLRKLYSRAISDKEPGLSVYESTTLNCRGFREFGFSGFWDFEVLEHL